MTVPHSRFKEPGRPEIDRDACTRCGLCVATCPTETLVTQDGGGVAVCQTTFLGCIACGQCMMVCPADCIRVTGRGVSPGDVQALPGGAAGADALEALMLHRRSIRRFQDRDVEPELLDRIVSMASTAPMGIPPWDVGCVVVRGRADVREVVRGVVRGYEGFLRLLRPWVLALMRPFMRKTTHEVFRDFLLPLAREYTGKFREGRDAVFYDAPAVLIFHHSPYAESTDAAIACTYAMLAAESLGLGTTMIGGACPIIQRNPALCRSLGIPEGHKPSIALIVGHPAQRFRKTIRRAFSPAQSPS